MTHSSVKLALSLTQLAVLLVCVVVSLGAFTRLVHAGLGCPDWPGCYGHLTWPSSGPEIAAAEAAFPNAPVEPDKTWPEMVHRYYAGALALVVLAITLSLLVGRRQRNGQNQTPPLGHGIALLLLVLLQAAFGMWTVTLKLWPQVVTAHLLGGFATLCGLWLLRLRLLRYQQNLALDRRRNKKHQKLHRSLLTLGLVLVLQIALGGWTSANYAAMACPDIPTCQGRWLPDTDFASGFNIGQAIGPNYLGGMLDGPARAAIHISHRLGALAVTLVAIFTIWQLTQIPFLRNYYLLLTALLSGQLALGIANIVLVLPLPIALAHNAGGALLLVTVIAIAYRLRYPNLAGVLPLPAGSANQKTRTRDKNHEPFNKPAL